MFSKSNKHNLIEQIMKAPTQIQPPANWQDFETLCKKLWGEIWNCSDTIKKNGRSGQEQCGVDVYGAPNNGTEYYGIQCKGKDNYTHAQLTTKEIDEEISKALNFKPQLKRFYFATTAVKDAKIEEYIRSKNIESQSAGRFGIEIFCWEDIVDKLKENRNTYHWYINDCQYIDSPDVDVQVVGDNFKLTPVLLKKTTKYSLYPFKKGTVLRQLFDFQRREKVLTQRSLLYGPIKENYSWCNVTFKITNSGSTVLSDFHLTLYFLEGITDIDTGYHYCNDPFINSVERTYINNRIDNAKELFYSELYSNSVEFRPKNTKLVQEEPRFFKLSLLTDLHTDKVTIGWIFLSNGYKKTGKLVIDVSYIIEEDTKTIYVDSVEDLKPEESTLEYKIIEE